jgi:hypothetical protein
MPTPTAAAVAIQRRYRRFRRQFPAAGRLKTRSSSSSPRIYQEDPRIASQLSRLLAADLVRFAKLTPPEREAEIADSLARSRVSLLRGMIRAAHNPATGRMAFTGGPLAAWAVKGYEAAVTAEPRVADLTGPQISYLLIILQKEVVPELAAVATGHPRPRVIRSNLLRKSRSPKHGNPLREVPAPDDDAIVGAPGDTFRVKADMRRFLGFALGSFARYAWQMNPRRRRRRLQRKGASAFRLKRWFMHSNLGVTPRTLYVWLRAMHGWAGRMDPSRNWEALYPRPLVFDGPALSPRLAATLRDLLRRHLLGVQPAASTLGPFPGVLTRTHPRRQPRAGTRLAGLFGDGRHAGAFVLMLRRATRGWVLQVALLDPLGMVTFPVSLQDTMRAELERAVEHVGAAGDVVQVQVAFVPVPRKLAVQYASEGACGPSAIALLTSALRRLRTLPTAATPATAAHEAFRCVSDEDVVLAAQLHHNAVL